MNGKGRMFLPATFGNERFHDVTMIPEQKPIGTVGENEIDVFSSQTDHENLITDINPCYFSIPEL